VLEGLTAGGAWADDAQVVTLEVYKVYAAKTGADIVLQEVAVIT
jgi:Holliday junction resolvase RusA-like endonuclease